jgi:transcription termination factor 2
LTTYGIVRSESNKNGAVTGVKWRRIILDEAHQIRNDESLTAEAVCRLSAQSRWALTGTPVHNKDKDMYSMLKFLRCPLLGNAQVRLPPESTKCTYFSVAGVEALGRR